MTPRLYDHCTRCDHPYANHSRSRYGHTWWEHEKRKGESERADTPHEPDCDRCFCPRFTIATATPRTGAS